MATESNDVQELLNKVLNLGLTSGFRKHVSPTEILTLCKLARQVFMEQPALIEVDPPIILCGDIHGQFVDLIRIFGKEGFPPKANYLFLGDYVDRGRQNLETLILLLCYKIKYRNNFFMLRGNHELSNINKVYGFLEECQRRFRMPFSKRIWMACQAVFDWMPIAATIGGRILCMHGGLSPHLETLEQLRELPRPLSDATKLPLAQDLLWADPDQWTEGFKPNTRGCSFVFGADVVKHMCEKLSMDFVVRAHQVVQDGYEFFADRHLVTLFSAPHYCGQFDNSAATMMVDANMLVTFAVYKPVGKKGVEVKKSVEEQEEEEKNLATAREHRGVKGEEE